MASTISTLCPACDPFFVFSARMHVRDKLLTRSAWEIEKPKTPAFSDSLHTPPLRKFCVPSHRRRTALQHIRKIEEAPLSRRKRKNSLYLLYASRLECYEICARPKFACCWDDSCDCVVCLLGFKPKRSTHFES